MKEEESSEEEATAATPAEEQDAVPAELDGVRTPEPLEDTPKREDQEGSSPETSLPYKWVVEAANLLIPAVGSSFSEALDLIESVMLVTALPSGPRVPSRESCGRASFCSLVIPVTFTELMLSAQPVAMAWGHRDSCHMVPALRGLLTHGDSTGWGRRAPQRRWQHTASSRMVGREGGCLRPRTQHSWAMVFATPQMLGCPWRGTWELVGLER